MSYIAGPPPLQYVVFPPLTGYEPGMMGARSKVRTFAATQAALRTYFNPMPFAAAADGADAPPPERPSYLSVAVDNTTVGPYRLSNETDTLTKNWDDDL